MTQFASGIDAPPRHAALDDAHVGDIRGALKALIIANEFLEEELRQVLADGSVSAKAPHRNVA